MRLCSLVSRPAYIFFTGHLEAYDVIFKFISCLSFICELREKERNKTEDVIKRNGKPETRKKERTRKEKMEVGRKRKGNEREI